MKTYVGLPFEQFPDRPSSRLIRNVLLPYMSYTVFALAALGLLLTWKRKRQYLLVVYLAVAQNVAFYGSPRFHAPIEPLLVLLVGGVFWWLGYNKRSVLTGLRAVTQGLPHQRFLNRAKSLLGDEEWHERHLSKRRFGATSKDEAEPHAVVGLNGGIGVAIGGAGI